MGRTYGLSRLERAALIESQQGYCRICRVYYGDMLIVDHDHFSGEVRGLLCKSCNSGLGFFKDNPNFLHGAAKYLN